MISPSDHEFTIEKVPDSNKILIKITVDSEFLEVMDMLDNYIHKFDKLTSVYEDKIFKDLITFYSYDIMHKKEEILKGMFSETRLVWLYTFKPKFDWLCRSKLFVILDAG